MKKLKINNVIVLGLCFSMVLGGCSGLKKLTREQKGAIIGVGAGAAAGAVVGSKSKNPAVYAIVGSAVGGVAGAFIGKYMDKQAKDLEEDLAGIAKVERIEEGIKVTMGSGILFGFDSYALSQGTKSNLNKLASTLLEYEKTEILIAGHTDNVGSEEYNLKLSEKRADAVSDYLIANGVKKSRLVSFGYGESTPEYDNSTATGQDKNRRVELAIVADDDLKKEAKAETKNMALFK